MELLFEAKPLSFFNSLFCHPPTISGALRQLNSVNPNSIINTLLYGSHFSKQSVVVLTLDRFAVQVHTRFVPSVFDSVTATSPPQPFHSRIPVRVQHRSHAHREQTVRLGEVDHVELYHRFAHHPCGTVKTMHFEKRMKNDEKNSPGTKIEMYWDVLGPGACCAA